MKVQHLIITIFLFGALLYSGCREITVTTRVNKDGSFTRIVTITGDSADVFRKNLPYPVDESWVMEVKHDTVDSSLYVTYTKSFGGSDELNLEIKSDTSWKKQLDRRIDVHRSFGFFYSKVSYDEVIKAANPFKILNFKDFLTPDELQWLNNTKKPRTTADTAIMDKVENKAMEYLGKTVAAELILTLENGINELNDPAIDPGIVQMSYDSILSNVYHWGFDKPSLFIDKIARWQNDTAILKLKTLEPGLFASFNKKLELLEHLIEMQDYTVSVEMPGIITETNSNVVKGNSVSWKVDSFSFLYADYTMHVESRVVNRWMFYLTGFLLLALILLLIVKAFKPRGK